MGLGAPAISHVFSARRDASAREHELAKQRREMEAERDRVDVEELRLLLDQVAQNITQALGAFYVIRSMFIQLGATTSPEAQKAMSAFREWGQKVDIDRSRVAIRLGADHAVCEAHARIAQAIVDTAQHVGVAQSMGQQYADLEKTWDVVKKSGENLYEARDHFLAEAVRLVGSRIT